MNWNREADTINTFPLQLDIEGKSKRSILKTLNSVYDIFSFYGPLLVRAKLFMQRLQGDGDLTWDAVISEPLQ